MTSPEHQPPPAITVQPSSPRFPKPTTTTLTPGSQRKVAIAVDLSDESAYAVNWAVQNYLRPDDHVILLHVSPTSFLYGADWGPDDKTHHQHHDFDSLTLTKTHDLAKPLIDANINYKTHIVKDHDMKERLCLEVERLGLSAVIMGSRGFGSSASRRLDKGQRRRLGSVSDYCVHHCVCPVVVVRFPDGRCAPSPKRSPEFHDASDKQTDLEKPS
ncbi:universal stress protein PHOS32-like [Bidens hawaiensis]|uniref:universal stress protein PHOS32-like n=1 Tax=Bidens hawaiensis TaxID=980011 RepID=UPI00404B36F5